MLEVADYFAAIPLPLLWIGVKKCAFDARKRYQLIPLMQKITCG
jgi:hypothetical protein